MKFTASRDSLLKPLQLVHGVVERRQTLPILANLLLVATEDGLALTGTDQEVEITGRCDANTAEVGEITVPARKVMEICRNLPDGAVIEASLQDKRLSLVSGRFRSHLATLAATEFPNVEMPAGYSEISLPGAGLHRLMNRTSFAMAQQDVRYFFNGMLLETSEGRLRTVATNGQRLAMCTLDEVEGIQSEQQLIIPRKGVIELLRLVNDDDRPVQLQLTENHLRAVTEEGTLTTKLIDGAYPEYEKAIPTGGNNILVGDRQEIREALVRTAILSNEMYRNVRLELGENTLRLQANNPQQEEAEETVSIDYGGEPIEIAFNVEYLLDVLAVLSGEQIRMTLSDANGPVLVEESGNSDSVYVVSPMML